MLQWERHMVLVQIIRSLETQICLSMVGIFLARLELVPMDFQEESLAWDLYLEMPI